VCDLIRLAGKSLTAADEKIIGGIVRAALWRGSRSQRVTVMFAACSGQISQFANVNEAEHS
jgi:hypothetical protein